MKLVLDDRGENNRVDVQGDLAGEDFIVAIKGDNNRIILGDQVSSHHNQWSKPSISIAGNNNLVFLGHHTSIKANGFLRIIGSDNRVNIENHCSGAFRLDIQTGGALFEMGEHTTAVGMLCTIFERQKVVLGKDCMFSASVWMTASDMHSVIDIESGERINPAADVIIGDHVWFGFESKILKGVRIGSGSVIGAAAVVTREVPENCIVAGNPARIVRENVRWDRSLVSQSFSATAKLRF
jgi:acetyltransferase-like isoleucine patch superfamily enzyme